MATGSFVIQALDRQGWRIGRCGADRPQWITVDVPADADPQQTAQHLATTLCQNGYEGQAVALAIPSNWCLCAGVSTDGLPRKGTHGAMTYRLEEKLPIAAEEAVADFVPRNGHALGVCVQLDKLAPIIESLEQHDVQVDLICPTAMLALQHKVDVADSDHCDAIVWGQGQQLELFSIQDNKPSSWHLLSNANDDDLSVQLGMAALRQAHPLRVATSGVDTATRDCIAALPDVELITQDDQSMPDAAAAEANEIVTGKQPSWINLRRDGLATTDTLRRIRKPVVAAIAAAVVFLACLSGAMLWRADRYQQIAAKHESQLTALYRQQFPNRPVPVNIKSRFQSEQRRLGSLHGNGSPLPHQTPVLLLLRDAMSCLPTSGRYRIFELRIDEGNFYLEGQVQSHSQADAIAAALNAQDHFKVDPPRTENLSGREIAFTIRGTTIHTRRVDHSDQDDQL